MAFFRSKPAPPPVPSVQEMVPGEGRLLCRFRTSMGDMVAELYEKEAPHTVANFVALALGRAAWTDPRTGRRTERPLYSGTIFHRVIEGFMLQGGDPTGTGRGGPGWNFADEFHPSLRHVGKGILSMANAGPDTNGSQFFICQVACPWLDGKHAVFGKVIEGLDVIDRIAAVPKGPGDRPREDVVLQEVEVWRA